MSKHPKDKFGLILDKTTFQCLLVLVSFVGILFWAAP